MSAREEAIHAIDRALGLLPKTGAMTELDTNLLRYSLGHAREAVDKIEELKRPRRAKKVGPGAS